MDTISVDRIAESVEREFDRLRIARPHLHSNIGRAENILVTHLSCPKASIIKPRIRGGELVGYLVKGSGGAVYKVDPHSFSCTCPDHHRRGKGCKHSIACYVLGRAFRPTLRMDRRCEAEPKITRHEAVREPSASYEVRECACDEGMVYEAESPTGRWVACGTCSGTGRARVFVYPKKRRLHECVGCGSRFGGLDLVEVQESLTFFRGDLLCHGCWHSSDAEVL